MNVCERLSRESVSLDDLDDDEEFHATADRSRVRAFTRALRRGDALPPIFVTRQDGELTLIQGIEQVAAAERLGFEELDVVVFDALSDAESDEVGTLGFALAENGQDVWGGLRRAYGASCSVTLLPGMVPADRASMAARVRAAGIEPHV